MPNSQTQHEDYLYQDHNTRIKRLEDHVTGILYSDGVIKTKLDDLANRIDNSIVAKLEALTLNMSILMPYMEERKDWDKVFRNSLFVTVCSGGAALLLFVLHLYFNHA